MARSVAVDPAPLRTEADLCIEQGLFQEARAALVRLWSADPTGATAAFVVSRFERLRGKIDLVLHRVYILRSFTVEPAVPFLRAGGYAGGLDLHVELSDFNTIAQEVLDPGSRLYAAKPNTIILATQTRDLSPKLWSGFAELEPAQVVEEIRTLGETMSGFMTRLRASTTSSVVVHSFETPQAPALGLADASMPSGQWSAIREANHHVANAATKLSAVYILDVDAMVARRGSDQWRDERRWLTARVPISAPELVHLSREWLKFIHPISGKLAKVAVCDLDNTLWGGVVGEDGVDGIKIGHDHPGAAFQELQRALLDLRARGVLLAICSKNNPADAFEVFDTHSEMLLKREHFAATRINWDDKATNLRSLAAELNVGVDALAFIDDNPVERRFIQTQLPDTAVIELPDNPYGYAKAVRDCPLFERLSLSKEDRQRSRLYAEQAMRAQLQESASSVEDFYRSLQQEVEVVEMTAASLGRTAQLTQKTNQFNLTTQRYSEAELAELAATPTALIHTIRVRDRFGDNGLVGAAIMRFEGAEARIDTFLLSCRVIGRTVETAFLSFLADVARKRGARELVGEYISTKKNGPARSFYPSHSFSLRAESEGRSEWCFDLSKDLPWPEWIAILVSESKH